MKNLTEKMIDMNLRLDAPTLTYKKTSVVISGSNWLTCYVNRKPLFQLQIYVFTGIEHILPGYINDVGYTIFEELSD